MTQVGLNSTSAINSFQSEKLKNQSNNYQSQELSKSLPIEKTQVNISDEGRALSNAISKSTNEEVLTTRVSEKKDASTAKKTEDQSEVTSFALGALGIDNPETIEKEEKNTSYTAGQYLKGALTVGTILLAII